jgi:ribosomal-protein-alanine N-acetyltransferase
VVVVVPELRTQRLLLRAFVEVDRPAWARIHADPAVMATLGPLLDRVAADRLLEDHVTRWDRDGYGWWCVDLDGECIGAVGLTTQRWAPPFTLGDDRFVDLGWRISSAHWGRGYAPEAAAAAIEFAFDGLRLSEIVAFTAETNTKSRRVMEKLGMVHDSEADFDHPNVAAGDPLRRHVLYRLARRV